MAQPLQLEVFETPQTPDGPVFLMPEQVEDIRLNAYEHGYGAGWDDGGQQGESEDAAHRAEIRRQVEQISFGYHEARAHVLNALNPLLTAVFDIVLPEVSRAAIVPLVIDQLLPLAHGAAEEPLVLTVPQGMRARFEAAFEGLVLPPLTLNESAELADAQAVISQGESQSHVDLTQATDSARMALERFYQFQNEDSKHA